MDHGRYTVYKMEVDTGEEIDVGREEGCAQEGEGSRKILWDKVVYMSYSTQEPTTGTGGWWLVVKDSQQFM